MRSCRAEVTGLGGSDSPFEGGPEQASFSKLDSHSRSLGSGHRLHVALRRRTSSSSASRAQYEDGAVVVENADLP